MISKVLVFALVFVASNSYEQDMDIKNKTVVATDARNTTHVYVAPSGKIFSHFSDGEHGREAANGVEYELGKTIRYTRSAGNIVTNYVATANLSARTLRLSYSAKPRIVVPGRTVDIAPDSGSIRIAFDGDACTFFDQQKAQSCKVVSGNQMPQ